MRLLSLVAALMFTAAITLTIAVALAETPMRGEARVVREVQGWPFPGGALSDVIRALTTTWLIIVLGCVLAAALALTGSRREALAVLGMLFVLSWLQPALKEIVDRPRPAGEMFEIRGSITSESFPAGHVMSPTVLYGYVVALSATMKWPRAVRATGIAVSVAILALTGMVSLWLGVHWPADVIGGYLWGGAIVLAGVAAAGAIDRLARDRGT